MQRYFQSVCQFLTPADLLRSDHIHHRKSGCDAMLPAGNRKLTHCRKGIRELWFGHLIIGSLIRCVQADGNAVHYLRQKRYDIFPVIKIPCAICVQPDLYSPFSDMCCRFDQFVQRAGRFSITAITKFLIGGGNPKASISFKISF